MVNRQHCENEGGGWRDVVEAASCIESAIVTTESENRVEVIRVVRNDGKL